MIQAQLREQFPVDSTPAVPIAPSSQPGFWAGLRLRQIAMLVVGLAFILVKSYESLQAFFLTHPEVRLALIGSSAAAGLTALGALGVLFTRRISERTQDVLLGYGGGIMLAASVFSLIIPAMNQAQALGYEKTGAVLLTATGIMLGGLFVLAINQLIPHQHFIAPNPAIQSMRTSRIWMFVMAVTIHNFPEGLAIGVGFGGDDIGKAIALATGIGIQDIPEGLVVALALRTPYDRPCDIDNTAPEPGDTAIMQAAMKKVIQVAKLMLIPYLDARCSTMLPGIPHCNGPPA